MSSAYVTENGQVTIPQDIRDALNIQTNDRIEFTLLPDGTLITRVKNRNLMDLFGILHKEGRPTLEIEKMRMGRNLEEGKS